MPFNAPELLSDKEAEDFADEFISRFDDDEQGPWDYDEFGPDAEVWADLDE